MTHNAIVRGCVCAAVIAVVALPLGCRRRDPYTDAYLEIVSAEKRDLEDQIYALEDKLEQRESELEALKGRTPTVKPPARGGGLFGPKKPATATSPPPGVMDDADLMPPMIDPGIPVEPKIELPPVEATPKKPVAPAPKPPLRSFKPTSSSTVEKIDEALTPPAILDVAPEKTQPSEELPPPASEPVPSFRKPAADAELIDPQVSTLFINPFHTAGVELDQQPGDDGLMILFEPRNAAGQFVPQAANVTIVALDPAAEGDAARVAKWELSKTEVGKRMLDARPDRGVKVQLKWPEKRPEHGRLKLFVRYEADGRKVEGQSDVFVTLPGQISQRWTPRKE